MKTHLTKLALVAAVALGSMGMARAADSSTVAAKLKAVSTANVPAAKLPPPPPLTDPNRTDLMAWWMDLSNGQQTRLTKTYKDLPRKVQVLLLAIWNDLPVSAG